MKSHMIINLDDNLDHNMVETTKNDNEFPLIFSRALTLATSDTPIDPPLEYGPCLEIDIAPCIVLVVAHLISCLPYFYNDEQDWEVDDFLD